MFIDFKPIWRKYQEKSPTKTSVHRTESSMYLPDVRGSEIRGSGSTWRRVKSELGILKKNLPKNESRLEPKMEMKHLNQPSISRHVTVISLEGNPLKGSTKFRVATCLCQITKPEPELFGNVCRDSLTKLPPIGMTNRWFGR